MQDDGPQLVAGSADDPALLGTAFAHRDAVALPAEDAPAIDLDGLFRLTAPYPNPFNPEARFTLAVRAPRHVRVAVYDLLGRTVALLHDAPMEAGRTYGFTLDGSRWPSGLYVLHARGEHFQSAIRVVLVK